MVKWCTNEELGKSEQTFEKSAGLSVTNDDLQLNWSSCVMRGRTEGVSCLAAADHV